MQCIGRVPMLVFVYGIPGGHLYDNATLSHCSWHTSHISCSSWQSLSNECLPPSSSFVFSCTSTVFSRCASKHTFLPAICLHLIKLITACDQFSPMILRLLRRLNRKETQPPYALLHTAGPIVLGTGSCIFFVISMTHCLKPIVFKLKAHVLIKLDVKQCGHNGAVVCQLWSALTKVFMHGDLRPL